VPPVARRLDDRSGDAGCTHTGRSILTLPASSVDPATPGLLLLLTLFDRRSATSHKKNNTEDPSNKEADKRKLAQRRAVPQFGCL
jgi:hypothetical protein